MQQLAKVNVTPSSLPPRYLLSWALFIARLRHYSIGLRTRFIAGVSKLAKSLGQLSDVQHEKKSQ
jgi:hypothetical protein